MEHGEKSMESCGSGTEQISLLDDNDNIYISRREKMITVRSLKKHKVWYGSAAERRSF